MFSWPLIPRHPFAFTTFSSSWWNTALLTHFFHDLTCNPLSCLCKHRCLLYRFIVVLSSLWNSRFVLLNSMQWRIPSWPLILLGIYCAWHTWAYLALTLSWTGSFRYSQMKTMRSPDTRRIWPKSLTWLTSVMWPLWPASLIMSYYATGLIKTLTIV